MPGDNDDHDDNDNQKKVHDDDVNEEVKVRIMKKICGLFLAAFRAFFNPFLKLQRRPAGCFRRTPGASCSQNYTGWGM